jgi:Na+-transporting methylmalonyl-CoA/oxaloacetate decarboxylase beta subunit
MLSNALIIHVMLWLGIFFCWLLATRHYHPTLLIAVLVTTILVSASALAVYINRHVLQAQFARHRSLLKYAVLLIALLVALDLIAVLSIQRIYDLLWGPDPNRFGFWFNFGSDGFIIVLHLIAAVSLEWIMKQLHKRNL